MTSFKRLTDSPPTKLTFYTSEKVYRIWETLSREKWTFLLHNLPWLTIVRLFDVSVIFLQGVSLPPPSTLSNTQHEEDWCHEERRHLLCRVPQSLHPLAAAITHPRSGAGVRNTTRQPPHPHHPTHTHTQHDWKQFIFIPSMCLWNVSTE